MRATLLGIVVLVAAAEMTAGSASGQTVGCPAGKVIQGVNFATRSLVCVSVGTAQIAALQAAVSALQAEVHALQGQLAALLTSPNGQFSITVGDTGIELAGPGGTAAIQVLDMGSPGSPIPTVRVNTTKLQMTVEGDTEVTTGGSTSIATGGNTTIATGGNTSIATSGNTSIHSDQNTGILTGRNTSIESGVDTSIGTGRNTAIESNGDTRITSAGTIDIVGSVVHVSP